MKLKQELNKIKSKFKLNKRHLLIATVALLFIAITVFGLFSRQSWINYQFDYNEKFNLANQDLTSAIDGISSDKKTATTEKLSQLIKVQDDIKNNLETYCEPNTLISWQGFIKWTSDKVKSCEQEKNSLSETISKLEKVTNYLKAEQALASIINVANSDTAKNNSPEKWKLIDDIWLKATTQIDSIESPEEFKDISKTAKQYLTAIASAWNKLSKANDDENRNNFETAEKNLESAYNNLAKISKTSQTKLKLLISEF